MLICDDCDERKKRAYGCCCCYQCIFCDKHSKEYYDWNADDDVADEEGFVLRYEMPVLSSIDGDF